jgi:hypothetical protein
VVTAYQEHMLVEHERMAEKERAFLEERLARQGKAALHRFGAGFHPTEPPQEFESLRTNPQEPTIARTARW